MSGLTMYLQSAPNISLFNSIEIKPQNGNVIKEYEFDHICPQKHWNGN